MCLLNMIFSFWKHIVEPSTPDFIASPAAGCAVLCLYAFAQRVKREIWRRFAPWDCGPSPASRGSCRRGCAVSFRVRPRVPTLPGLASRRRRAREHSGQRAHRAESGRRRGTLRANTESDVQTARGVPGSQITDRLVQTCWADRGFPPSCAKKGRRPDGGPCPLCWVCCLARSNGLTWCLTQHNGQPWFLCLFKSLTLWW
jgi:hypothetical protein